MSVLCFLASRSPCSYCPCSAALVPTAVISPFLYKSVDERGELGELGTVCKQQICRCRTHRVVGHV